MDSVSLKTIRRIEERSKRRTMAYINGLIKDEEYMLKGHIIHIGGNRGRFYVIILNANVMQSWMVLSAINDYIV